MNNFNISYNPNNILYFVGKTRGIKMILKGIRFIKEGDFVHREGERLEIVELNVEYGFIAYKDAKRQEHYTTEEAFFSKKVEG